MHADEAGNVRPDTDNPMNHVGVNLENIQVTALDFFNVPSPHITPKHMLKLYQEIKKTLITMTALSSLMAQIP